MERATESLNLQKGVKAYYRRAKAKAALKDFWGAVTDLREAINLDPEDPNDFQTELDRYEAMGQAKDKQSDKKLQGWLLKWRGEYNALTKN